MKRYMTPATQVNETQTSQMMAVSLALNDTEVDGDKALTKEDATYDWDIWN